MGTLEFRIFRIQAISDPNPKLFLALNRYYATQMRIARRETSGDLIRLSWCIHR